MVIQDGILNVASSDFLSGGTFDQNDWVEVTCVSTAVEEGFFLNTLDGHSVVGGDVTHIINNSGGDINKTVYARKTHPCTDSILVCEFEIFPYWFWEKFNLIGEGIT